MRVQLVFCVFVKLAIAEQNLKLLYQREPNVLAEAVEEIIDKHYAIHQPIINLISPESEFDHGFAIKDFLDELLDRRFKRSNLSYRQERSSKLSITNRRRRATILTINTFEGFLQYFSLIDSKSFRFNGFYLIVLVSGEIKEIEKIFKTFWQIQIYNVNCIFEDERGKVVVKTFMPFTKGNCHNTRPLIIDRFTNGSFKNDVTKIFPKKMNNLFDCSIRVALSNNISPAIFAKLLVNQSYSLRGRDINLLNTIAESLNFHIDLTFIGEEGFLMDNGTAEGPLKALMDREADISISDWWIKKNRLQFFDSTTSYNSDKIVFLVPPGREFTGFETLIFPFTISLWLLILAWFLLGILVIFIIKLRPMPIQNFVFGEKVRTPYMNLINGYLGGTQTVLPKTNFARFLLTMLLIYALVIRTLYQASFFKLLKSNAHFQAVESVGDIVKRDYRIYVNSETVDVFSESLLLKNRLKFVEGFELDGVLDKIQSDSSFKGAYGSSLMRLYYKNQMIPIESRFHYCDEVVLTLPLVIYTLKDFYLIDAINEKIEIIKTSGFIEFWQNLDINKVTLEDKDTKPPRALAFHDFKGSLQVLFIGFFLGLVVFLFELLRSICSRRVKH